MSQPLPPDAPRPMVAAPTGAPRLPWTTILAGPLVFGRRTSRLIHLPAVAVAVVLAPYVSPPAFIDIGALDRQVVGLLKVFVLLVPGGARTA